MTLWRKTHSQYHLMHDFFHQQLSSPRGESHKWSKSALKVDASEKRFRCCNNQPWIHRRCWNLYSISQCQVNLVVLKLHHIMSWFPCALIRYIAYKCVSIDRLLRSKHTWRPVSPNETHRKWSLRMTKGIKQEGLTGCFNRVLLYMITQVIL